MLVVWLAVTALAGGSIAMLLMSKGAGKGNIFWIIVIAIVGVDHPAAPLASTAAPTREARVFSCCGTLTSA